MHLLFRHSFRRNYCHLPSADTTFKWVRDRGLDHAVEREKNLKPLLNIKNLIKSEPSKSLPISIITKQKDSLKIPFRPIDFVRKYPSIFQEFFPGNIGVQPHIKLTPEVLNLDAEELLVYQSETYKQVVADRLLKLLMISRINKVPLKIIENLKWDIGLPQDYLRSIVPEFPDYFRVIGSKDSKDGCFGSGDFGELELVCWSNELAVSVMEKKAKDGEKIVFSEKFSSGFVIDKKTKKWMDDWQKLPYISPYENAAHLLSKSDESDKWVVAILHEVISLFGAKKVDRENLFCLGEYLGIRSRFKRALLNHPGVFYVSSKVGAYTVVLREGYRRGALMESDPLMNIRNQYIHLMNMMKEDCKVIAPASGSEQQEKELKGEEREAADEDSEDEKDVQLYDSSGSEEEGARDDNLDDDDESGEEEEDNQMRTSQKNAAISRGKTARRIILDTNRDDDEEEEEEEDSQMRGSRNNAATSRGKTARSINLDRNRDMRNPERGKSIWKHLGAAKDDNVPQKHMRKEKKGDNIVSRNSEEEEHNRMRGSRINAATSRGKTARRINLDRNSDMRNPERGKSVGKHLCAANNNVPQNHMRKEKEGDNNVSRNSEERSNFTRSHRRSSSEKRTSV
ncbi:hypothetical protein Pint_07770 [Pistacia integerrima]|uniref:Uncharacterized protein n=1 Tax=Pistacia integerrima TaxID=434235 RepID=A0ACC0XVV8_9ROSI|nr:hypothetical protein Pint_07770 [Pistacia integerrima]